jgi:hypothetical protein
MSVQESIPLNSIVTTDYSELNPVKNPRSTCCDTVTKYAGKAWSTIKNAPGAIAGAVGTAVGVPLIVKSAEMVKRSYEGGPSGWTAWNENFSWYTESLCTAHLGEAAFNRIGGFEGLLQGTKYLSLPVGYALGKCMKGRVGNVLMKTAAVTGAGLDIAGNYGSIFAIQSGVRAPATDAESFVEASEQTEESTGATICSAKLSAPAITLFSSIVARAAGNILLGLAAGMYFGRKN